VRRSKEGDAEALNELFSRYHARMVRLANKRLGPRLRGKEEADDLAQTTFREAARDFGHYEYRGEESLLRWLVQILKNKIRDKAEFYSAGKRDVSRERTIDGDTSEPKADEARRYEPPSDDLSVTRQVQRNEEFSILRDALEKLSPEHRTAITLVFFQGLSLREAGAQMDGRSEDAVRMLLRRAEAKLREITRPKLG
jgi:RNA polymerase sigma-70 factor (ECF subfamily)